MSHFPKEHRFRLARRIEDAAFGFHERLLLATRAGSSREEMRLLLQADVELDKLRHHVRLAADRAHENERRQSLAASWAGSEQILPQDRANIEKPCPLW